MQSSMLPRLKQTISEPEHLKGIEWKSGIAMVICGVRIGIRANDQGVFSQFLEHFPFEWKPAKLLLVDRLYSIVSKGKNRKGGFRYHLAYENSAEMIQNEDPTEVFFEIERYLIIYLSNRAKHRVFIDAGVVGWQDKAIIIPGHCQMGKTMLVAELVRAGATYYSDEYAVLDTQGRVNPLPIRLSMRDETGYHRLRYTAQSLGGENGVKPLPLGMVLITEYKPKARWRPQQLSNGQTILELLANSSTARWQPITAMSVIQRATAQALALKGVRGEASEMIPSLLKRLSNG